MTQADENARASLGASSLEEISGAVERELALLREARPHLASRVDRAATILVVQLSGRPRSRPMRVRVRGGKARFLVESMTGAGAVYVVDPDGWGCSCPDYHRRDEACKHALSAWVLWRASRPRPTACADCGGTFPPDRLIEAQEGQAEEALDPGSKICRVCAARHGLPVPGARQRGCSGCDGGWVYLTEQIVDTTTGELLEAVNPVRCRKCAPLEPGLLSDEEMARWMDESRWIFAKTYADTHPHEYCLRRHQDPERFDAAARTIWYLGWDRMYLQRPWRSMDVGGFLLWVWTKPQPGMPYPEDTILVNRAPRVHERQPGRRA